MMLGLSRRIRSWRFRPLYLPHTHSFNSIPKRKTPSSSSPPSSYLRPPSRACSSATTSTTASRTPERLEAQDIFRIAGLIRAFRNSGHIIAALDPLGGYRFTSNNASVMVPALKHLTKDLPHRINLEAYELGHLAESTVIDVSAELPSFGVCTLRELVLHLHRTYCGTATLEYTHVPTKDQKVWLRERIETLKHPYVIPAAKKRDALRWIVECETLETFLKDKFPGSKRFSLEGTEAIIPALFTVIGRSVQLGVDHIELGMAHRGRLNLLANIMNKPLNAMFKEFMGGSDIHVGDVKYHLGTACRVPFPRGSTMVPVQMALSANPSHLEAVTPVVMGRTRAAIENDFEGLTHRGLGVVVHGDASFSGQGIVSETLQLTNLVDYRVGGMILVVLNNQIGFTTAPFRGRSSMHPTDVAKAIGAPIFHVNGDDPDAVCAVSRLAAEYRERWRTTAVIDVVGYRRYGHNEQDEPMFTQPIMYSKIAKHNTLATLYSNRLIEEGVMTQEEIDAVNDTTLQHYKLAYEASHDYKGSDRDWLSNNWQLDVIQATARADLVEAANPFTGVDKGVLTDLGTQLSHVPEALSECYMALDESDGTGASGPKLIRPGLRQDLLPLETFTGNTPFVIHPDVEKIFKTRQKMVSTGNNIDWAFAETLAFATLMKEGTNVRLSGQDCERGTFNHRHAVIFDQLTEASYVPLTRLGTSGTFHVMNSNLSEAGVLAYEYGYSSYSDTSLVLWEAQFGDFANGAQHIIDTYIATGEHRWFNQTSLVLLLPHGMEGQGPDHSSARLERFLQMCSDDPDYPPGSSPSDLEDIDAFFHAADLDGSGELAPSEVALVLDSLAGVRVGKKEIHRLITAMDLNGTNSISLKEWRQHMRHSLRTAASLSANLCIVQPTTPANYFHALRRQVKRQVKIPLVIMSPKSLLHHRPSFSSMDALSDDTGFKRVLDDPLFVDADRQRARDAREAGATDEYVEDRTLVEGGNAIARRGKTPDLASCRRENVVRLIFCSGKVYYPLSRQSRNDKVAIIRLEQLAPFAYDRLRVAMTLYPNAKDAVWVQEEPKNMGAWHYVEQRFRTLRNQFFEEDPGMELRYVGPPSAPCPTGSYALHAELMKTIAKSAFDGLE